MEPRQTLILITVLFVSTALGFGAGSEFFGQDQEQKFTSFPDTRVDADNEIQELEFDNNSLNLMLEDSSEARFFIDKDQDGSFDIELENLTHDGEEHQSSQVVTFGRKSYRLFFSYMDDPEVSGDAYLEVRQIRQL